jgi:hypothetical protein
MARQTTSRNQVNVRIGEITLLHHPRARGHESIRFAREIGNMSMRNISQRKRQSNRKVRMVRTVNTWPRDENEW